MSIAGIANSVTSPWQVANRRQASAAPSAQPSDGSTNAPASATNSTVDPFRNLSPTDSIMVNLPNGLSIGMMHFGSPLDADGEEQMAKSVAQLAGSLAGLSGQAGSSAAKDATGAGQMAGGQQGDGSGDLLHVDMPNGITFDIRHWSQDGDTENAVTDQLTKTAAELADALKAYMNASPARSANASSTSADPVSTRA
jgi:hypothetical protein